MKRTILAGDKTNIADIMGWFDDVVVYRGYQGCYAAGFGFKGRRAVKNKKYPNGWAMEVTQILPL